MDPITLMTTAIAIATPYIIKSGESIAEKIGEDIWNWIKKPFTKEEEAKVFLDITDEKNLEVLKSALLEKIENDNSYKIELEKAVKVANESLQNNSQTVNNNAEIQKQININQNSGNIQM